MSIQNQQKVVNVILDERRYQDKKWTTPEKHALDRTIDEYVLYISGYMSELIKGSIAEMSDNEKLVIMRKITALGFACMEQHGAIPRLTT